jgi:DNA-binding beta-propeller fold protein YncE
LLKVWGRRGFAAGRLQKPRAMAIDDQDHLYIVDMTARVQLFNAEGKYLSGWRTPESQFGRPTGITIGRSGEVLVADTHYFRVLRYTPQGSLLADRTIGGTHGPKPGEFGFVTDAIEDSSGNVYVSEYGAFDRVQKFSADGTFILQWGAPGSLPGQFLRPQSLAVDAQDRVWVADACNHRIQIFDAQGQLVALWGRQGAGPGELYYPYGLALDGRGHAYVCEFGNNRVQKFSTDGESLGFFGTWGRSEGQFHNPWAVALDSRDRTYVLDTNNHRVQVVSL